jgi:hypothetical protein
MLIYEKKKKTPLRVVEIPNKEAETEKSDGAEDAKME